uniref:PPFIA binding protein 2 n=1 Tax=Oryzias latipes TaxID=8090 RepID=H2MYJ3_ORYLA
MEMEASHMLEAALEQMDDIIAGSKAMEFSCSTCDLQIVQLAEDLKLALELQPNQERDHLRAQLPTETAQTLMDWLQSGVNFCSPANNETYQDRLLRLEGDKESLVLQVSVLTDQVEAQGEKIRDLESSLEEHRQKLASTEEMLQQELMSRTSLETQKLDLMDEVSYLKLKLVSMEDLDCRLNLLEILHKELQETVKTLSNDTARLSEENRSIKETLLDLQARSMRDNLVIAGIPEEAGEDPENIVNSFIEVHLKLPKEEVQKISFHRVHRLGGKRPDNQRPRPIVAKFEHYKQKELVKSRGRELKDTHYSVNDQFPGEILRRRKILFPLRRKHLSAGARAVVAVDKLFFERQAVPGP